MTVDEILMNPYVPCLECHNPKQVFGFLRHPLIPGMLWCENCDYQLDAQRYPEYRKRIPIASKNRRSYSGGYAPF